MKGLEQKTFPAAELKAMGDDADPSTWRLSGWGSVFYVVDQSWTADIMAPGCFAADLPEFLARGFVGGRGHDWDNPIGRPLAAEERAAGLYVEGSILDTQHGRETRTLIQGGALGFLSIGFRALGKTWLDDFSEVHGWWTEVGYQPTARDIARAQYGCRRVDRAQLYEFSPVTVPAVDDASIEAVRSLGAGAEGRTLKAHSEAVLAAVHEWRERLATASALREQEGRGLSAEHRAGLRRLRDELDQVLAISPAVASEARAREAARQAAAFEAHCAKLLGVEVC